MQSFVLADHRIEDREDMPCKIGPDDLIARQGAGNEAAIRDRSILRIDDHDAWTVLILEVQQGNGASVSARGVVAPAPIDQVEIRRMGIQRFPDRPMHEVAGNRAMILAHIPPNGPRLVPAAVAVTAAFFRRFDLNQIASSSGLQGRATPSEKVLSDLRHARHVPALRLPALVHPFSQ
jgi:hypothetical protein